MKCLVTAGNTQVLIDKVRCITNIFSGRTGAQIALELHRQGHEVVLLTSRPEAVQEMNPSHSLQKHFHIIEYQTFDELHGLMAATLTKSLTPYDAIIHSAAVSDYLSEGVYAPVAQTHFDSQTLQFHSPGNVQLKDVAAGKVKSSHDELWLRFVKAPKLVDLVRQQWGFAGKLVKFKLEVGVSRSELEAIAEASRVQSQADLIVANTLEGMRDWALLGPVHGKYAEINRSELARQVVEALTNLP